MEPSPPGSLPTSKLISSSHTVMSPDPSSLDSSTSSTPDRHKPQLTMPTPPTTPSFSPSTAFPQTSPPLLSRSSSLSSPTSSPLHQPVRSFSKMGRSQLNAASTENGNVPQTPTTPEAGEKQIRPWGLKQKPHCVVSLDSPSVSVATPPPDYFSSCGVTMTTTQIHPVM